MTFATPLAGLAALAGLVPLGVAVLRIRRARALRALLGLPEPPAGARAARPLALACAFALLGVAATQPSLVEQRERLVRTDAEMLVVLDTSRSMLASSGPKTAPRFLRAAAFAEKLRAALPELPAGVASLNNRLLPYLFPTADDQAYAAVVRHAYGIQTPRPAVTPSPLATDFGELGEAAALRFFSPGARRRVLIVLSDAETSPFDMRGTLSVLRSARTTPIVVRVWRPGERIPRESYRSQQPDELRKLRAGGWPAYSESQLTAVTHRVRQAISTGPTARVGYRRRETPIAAAIALAALAPLLLLVIPAVPLRRRYA